VNVTVPDPLKDRDYLRNFMKLDSVGTLNEAERKELNDSMREGFRVKFEELRKCLPTRRPISGSVSSSSMTFGGLSQSGKSNRSLPRSTECGSQGEMKTLWATYPLFSTAWANI